MGDTYGVLLGRYVKATTELRNRKEFCPVSSKVEHTTDNRETKERYLDWVPRYGGTAETVNCGGL